MRFYGLRRPVVAAVGALLCTHTCLAADEVVAPAASALLIGDMAGYAENAPISPEAKAECDLQHKLPKEAEQYLKKLNVAVELTDKVDSAEKPHLSMTVDKLVAGRAGNGFGGRWVVSELGVTAVLKSAGTLKATQYFACSAGLGFNVFANLRACDRLDRCVDQIGKKVSKWVSTSLPVDTPVL